MNEISNQEPQPASRFSTRALLNSGLRSFVWLLVLVGGFLFLIPEWQTTFEEFGIELPVLSQLVVSLSDKAIKISFVFLPVVILLTIIAELGLLSIPRGANRKTLNKLAFR
jgi:type II secretory pathway component PulF